MADDDLLNLFEEWYRQEMPRLYNYICYQVQNTALAEELTAAVCERALTRLHQYDDRRGEFKVWMFGIARNQIRQHLRTLRHRPGLVSLDQLPEIRTQALSVEQDYQVREAFGQVVRHLATLPARDQEIVALRYGAGLSNAEIAELTGMKNKHVAVSLHRALKKLRRALKAVREA